MAAETIPESATEQDFHRRWMAATAGAAGDEVMLALTGGSIADRLAWVFQSGYQAAVRRCFPESGVTGWTCFAVAEPKDGPGCTLRGAAAGYVLQGRKTWVAGADCIAELVVSVGAGSERRFVLVPRDAEGVSISLPRDPAFLAEMKQGAASFENVHVPRADVVADPARVQWFRGAEPLYVLLALNACLKAHAVALGDGALPRLADAAIDLGRSLPDHLADKSRIVPGLKSLREATSAVIDAATPLVIRRGGPLARSWEADALLFGMFGVSGDRS